MARGWFVIQVFTGYEKKVCSELLNKKNYGALKDIVFDVKVPEEEYYIERKNKKVLKKRNLYPGYVLVEIDMPENEMEWKKVYSEIRSIKGVGMFLTFGDHNKKPVPLSYDDVKSIFEKTGEIKASPTKIESGYSVGEKVRIKEGPFKDFEGEIEVINEEKNNLVVRVEIFGRLTPIELDFNQVQRL